MWTRDERTVVVRHLFADLQLEEFRERVRVERENLVGIFRNKEDLLRALQELEKLKERAGCLSVEGSRLFNPGWHLAQDLKAMLTVSEAVTRSALARQESRGAHSRIDYPGLDSVWGTKNNVIVRERDTMSLRQTPVPEMPNELKQLLAEDK